MLSFLYQASNTMLSYAPAIGTAQGVLAYKDKHYLGIALGGAVTIVGLWANRRTAAKELGAVVGDAVVGPFTGAVAGEVAGAVVGPPGGIEGLSEGFRIFSKGITLWSTALLVVRLADLYVPETFLNPPLGVTTKLGDKSHRAVELAAPLSVVYAKIKHWLNSEDRIKIHIDSPDYIYFSCARPISGFPEHMGIRLSTVNGRTRIDGKAELRAFGFTICEDEKLLEKFFGFMESQRHNIEEIAVRSA